MMTRFDRVGLPASADDRSPSEPYTRALRRAALDPTTIQGRKPRALLAGAKP